MSARATCLLFLRAAMVAGICLAPVSAQRAITGRVIDQQGAPITTASVRLSSDTPRLRTLPEPVDAQGRFSITLPAGFSGSHVTCDVTASTFESRRITLDLTGAEIKPLDITLPSVKTATTSPLVHSRDVDRTTQSLDVFLENPTATAVQVRSVDVAGSFRISTHCASHTPAVVLAIQENSAVERLASITADLSSPRPWSERVMLEGELQMLGCGQMKFYFHVPHTFSLEPKEKQKIRVSLPRHMTPKGQKDKQELALETWESIIVTFNLNDGAAVKSALIVPRSEAPLGPAH